jgi:hypothetical protein
MVQDRSLHGDEVGATIPADIFQGVDCVVLTGIAVAINVKSYMSNKSLKLFNVEEG